MGVVTNPAISIDDPMWFYSENYIDWLVADCIDEFYNKSWLRSIELQKNKVNSRVKMISIGIDDEINREFGYPILNGRTFTEKDVLVGTYRDNIFPYYNKKEFIQKYGYDTEISLWDIMTDTKTFSRRLMVISFDGYSEFEGVYFIARRDGSSLIVIKGEKCVTKRFWKMKMVDKNPECLLTKELIGDNLFGDAPTGEGYTANDTDFIEYMNSHFFLRLVSEPQGTGYYYDGLAQNLITKVQYQGRPHAAIPVNKLTKVIETKRPNDTNAYSLYMGYEYQGADCSFLNAAMVFLSNGYLIFQGNEFVDDLIPAMSTSSLTSKIRLYIFDEFQKIGTQSMICGFGGVAYPPITYLPFKKNIPHPDNVRGYRRYLPMFWWSQVGTDKQKPMEWESPVKNIPGMYWQYDGWVPNPGSSIADGGEDVIREYIRKYDKLTPSTVYHRTDRGIFIGEQYQDALFEKFPTKISKEWTGCVEYPSKYIPSKWNMSLLSLNVFGRIVPGNGLLGYPSVMWDSITHIPRRDEFPLYDIVFFRTDLEDKVGYFIRDNERNWKVADDPKEIEKAEAKTGLKMFPLTLDYYEADPAITNNYFLNPYSFLTEYSPKFVDAYRTSEIDKLIKKDGADQFIGNLLWNWNYGFEDYVASKYYGNLRAYQLSKFVKLCNDNLSVRTEYTRRANAHNWKVRTYTIQTDDLLNKQHRVPVLTTEFIHPNPEDRFTFTKPQLWVETTTSDTIARFIEVFVNGLRIKTNLSTVVNGINYIFFDADLAPATSELIVALSRYANEEFEGKKTGSFTLTSASVPVPFPPGFGKVPLDHLLFYDKNTGEILDPNKLGLKFTEKKEQFDIENVKGDVENVITTPGLADISYLRTKVKEFYKTSEFQKIILESNKVNVTIPVSPTPPYLPPTEVDTDRVEISTDSLEGLNIDIGVTTTNHHFTEYRPIRFDENKRYTGTIKIERYKGYALPTGVSSDVVRNSFKVYMNGRLIPFEKITILGPDNGTDDKIHRYDTTLSISIDVVLDTAEANSDGDLIIEYLPFFTSRTNGIYPEFHMAGPCGKYVDNSKPYSSTYIDAKTASETGGYYAGGKRLSPNQVCVVSEEGQRIFFLKRVPSGSPCEQILTATNDPICEMIDKIISLDSLYINYPETVYKLQSMADDATMMLPYGNTYAYQKYNTTRKNGVDYVDLTDISQWSASINIADLPSGYLEQFGSGRVPEMIGSTTSTTGQLLYNMIYNGRFLTIDLHKLGESYNFSLAPAGYGPYPDAYGRYEINPIVPYSRRGGSGYDDTPLPPGIYSITDLTGWRGVCVGVIETLVMYKRNHPITIELPETVYGQEIRYCNIVALSCSDLDLYKKYNTIAQYKDPFPAVPMDSYMADVYDSETIGIQPSHIIQLNDRMVFEAINQYPKWNANEYQETVPLIISIKGANFGNFAPENG